MTDKTKIKVLCVGGTIDKVYFDAKSSYEVGEPRIGKFLEDHNVGFDFEVVSLMAKDSLDMTDEDRAILRQAVHDAQEDKIIVTHGTDTMVTSANAISDIDNKTVVFVGALAPAIFKDSDAVFNIGCAVATAQVARQGIYITMNGCVFEYDNVVKDVENNRFVRKS